MSITKYDRHLIVDGVDTGLVLARKDGAPMWTRSERTMYQGSDIIWEETDWREGLSSGGYGCDTRYKGRMNAPPKINSLDTPDAQNTYCQCVHNGAHYCGGVNGVYKQESGAWVLKTDLDGNYCINLCSFTASDGTSYLLAATYNDYYYSTDDGENWTQSSLTDDDAHADCFAAVGTVLYKAFGDELCSCTDPSNEADAADSWTTAETFGWANTVIRYMLSNNDELYVWKDEGLYINHGDHWELASSELITLQSAYSGINAIIWKGYIYFRMGENAIYYYSPEFGYCDTITPGSYIPEETQFKGQCLALAADEEWLYAFIKNSTEIIILAGRWETIEGKGTDFRWHEYTSLTYSDIHTALVTNASGDKCLWFGGESADGIKYIILCDKYPDVPHGTNAKFATGGQRYTGKYTGGIFDEYKHFPNITLKTDDTDTEALDGSTRSILAEWMDDDGHWNEIGTFTKSPLETLEIDGGMTFLESRLRFTLTNGEDATPIIKGFKCMGKVRTSRKVYVYNFVVLCANNINGNGETAKEIAAAIDKANRPEPVIIEKDGNDIQMLFTSVKQDYMIQEKGRPAEEVIYIQAEEIV